MSRDTIARARQVARAGLDGDAIPEAPGTPSAVSDATRRSPYFAIGVMACLLEDLALRLERAEARLVDLGEVAL